MEKEKQNISSTLGENEEKEDKCFTYEELISEVDEMAAAIPYEFNEDMYYDSDDMGDNLHDFMDDYIAVELDYKTNYNKKELERIADYYEISKRKKKKDELIEDIVLFEKESTNIVKVYQRKKMWKYIKEIKKDKYLKQFLILD
jgi:hypothetical protein